MVNNRPAAAVAMAPPPFPPSLVERAAARLKMIFLNITIEPAMFLMAFSGSLDNVSVSQMQIYKCCHVDFGFNDTVCNNLVKDFKPENEMVQDEIAQFNVYQEMVTSFFPIFFSFYLGAWCDTFGRKLCMYLFLVSRIIGQSILILLAYNMDWAKEWYLLTLVPTTLIGGHTAFSIGLSAFIADISRPDQRAFRMGMIHLASSLGRPLAAPLGAYLLEEGGFVCVISASLLGVVLSTLFLAFRMRSFKWVPAKKEKSEERHPFSLYHIKDALLVTFKKRPGPNRKYLMLLMLMIMIQIVPFYGEGTIAYLYVRTRYGWEVAEFSQYSSIVSSAGIVAQAVIIPLLAIFNAQDSLICICVLLSTLARHLIKAFASEGWMYYLAAFVDLIGSYSMSLIRAMLTCCAPLSEFGKIYAVLSALDNILPIGLTQAYASVWSATSETFPGAAFLMSAGFTCITLALAVYVHISLKGERFSVVVQAEGGEQDENERKDHKFYDDPPPPYYAETTISHI